MMVAATEALALADAEMQTEAELEAHALSGLEAEVDSVPAAEVGDAAQGPAAAEATVAPRRRERKECRAELICGVAATRLRAA